MRISVRHTTSYRYSEPIAYAIQSLRLTPQTYDGLTILTWRIRGEHRRELPSYTDGFGNTVHAHSMGQPHSSASITVEGTVETAECHGLVQGTREPLPPIFYLRETHLTRGDEAVQSLHQGLMGQPGSLGWLLDLMSAVRDRIDYQPGLTHSATTAREALEHGVGVCQDHAHVFIAAARCAGVPARYVSGYLWAGGTGEQREASHAWAEAFTSDHGWVGFDPSNRMRPTEAYIRIAVGLDYDSAAPVRGVRRGVAEEAMHVSVRVTTPAVEQ